MLDHAWIIPAIPVLSFVLILFFGKKMPKHGSEIGITAVGAVVRAVVHHRGPVDPAGRGRERQGGPRRRSRRSARDPA